MSKTIAKWINFDANTLEDNSTALRVKLDGSGGLASTASGIKINAGSVTNAMLAGSITTANLADGANIVLDNTAETITGLWDFTTAPTINSLAIATETYVDNALSGLDFQPDVLAKQVDGTLDPGVSPTTGDRYIVADTGTLHANFGTITGVGNNDIVEYDGADFVVVYDVSVQGEGAITWNQADNYFERYDGTSWDEFGGLSGVTAGTGLSKTGNTLNVGDAGKGVQVNADDLEIGASEIAGAGLVANGTSSWILDIGTGNGITVNADDIAIDPTALTTGGSAEIDGDKLDIDFTPTNYTPSTAPVEADSVDNLTAHLSGIDTALAGATGETANKEMHLVTAGEVTAGSFTLAQNPTSAGIVSVTPVGGPQQVNKQIVGATGATPDFDVLNTNELHINNNGTATGLSGEIEAGDVLIIEYVY